METLRIIQPSLQGEPQQRPPLWQEALLALCGAAAAMFILRLIIICCTP